MKLFSRIFSMLVIAFVFSVLFCAPTFAEESLSITVDGAAETTLNPNTFGTSSVDVYVTSTARDGYKLSISDSDENNSLVSSNGNSINPLIESVTESNFTTNAWGVKVGDNFLPVPKLTDNVLELANTTKAATNEKHTVTFGMKVDGTAASGAYSSEVVFTAVANPISVRKSILQNGTSVNAALKTLAKGSVASYRDIDTSITSIQRFSGVFTDEIKESAVNIAINSSSSRYPVWAWYDNGVIYYHTEADEVFFNQHSYDMFSNFQALTSIDFNFGLESDVDPDGNGIIENVQNPVYITSNVENMSNMFSSDYALVSLDVSKWDTSNVTDMSYMFWLDRSITNLDVSKWDTSKVTNLNSTFGWTESLSSLDVSDWDVSNVTNMVQLFNNARSLTTIDVSDWDTSNVTNMSGMFGGVNLTTIDVSRWDTSKVTSMASMFILARSLETIDVSNWNTSKVQNMQAMFECTTALTALDVSKWDVSNVTNMSLMFYYDSHTPHIATLDVSKWNTGKVTDMSNMFNGASSLTALDVSKWDTSKVINMSGMFYNAYGLSTVDVSNWDTSNVTKMSHMFRAFRTATVIDVSKWDTSKVTDMNQMFYGASSLSTLDVSNWDTSHVTDMSDMFGRTYALTTIYASDKYTTSAVTNSENMFTGAGRLVGGNGTVYSASHIDKEYARIDRPGIPGYFTEKRAVRKAYLKWGRDVNSALKRIANVGSASYDEDTNITSIKKYTGEFTDTIQASATNIAYSGESYYPVYAWFDNGTIYYYTEADEVFLYASSSDMFYNMQSLVSIDMNFGIETDVDPDGDGFIVGVQDPVYISSNVTDMSCMFKNDKALTTVDVSRLDTSNVVDMQNMFDDTFALVSLDVSNWNTSKVTNMSMMFNSSMIPSLTTLDVSKWNVGNVTDMSGMFSGQRSLAILDVSRWDTGNVTNMSWMFNNNTSRVALDVSKWDTSKVTNMNHMFSNASSLTSLDVSKWDTSKVTNMGSMFQATSSLSTLDVSKWDTSSVTNMGVMFEWAGVVILDLSNWDTSKVTDMHYMFDNESALTTIYASDRFDTNSVTNGDNMFRKASNLVGGNGTVYNANHIDKEYARIDAPSTPGYFTLKSN